MNLDFFHADVLSIKNTYKKMVTVGKDTIEAEYVTFEYINFKRTKTFKDKLENLWDTVTIPYWKIKNWVEDTYWSIRYGFQRMFKGYDDVDVFEAFDKFIERYIKILTDYRKNHVGHVGTMTNEEWEAIIDEMLYHLHYMDEQNIENELKKNVPNDWHVSQKTIDYIMNKHKDEFFKLFSEYFYNLWD